jgi:hypothetical protein
MAVQSPTRGWAVMALCLIGMEDRNATRARRLMLARVGACDADLREEVATSGTGAVAQLAGDSSVRPRSAGSGDQLEADLWLGWSTAL